MMKSKYRYLIGIALGVLLIETISWVIVDCLDTRSRSLSKLIEVTLDQNTDWLGDWAEDKNPYYIFNSELGWTVRPNGDNRVFQSNGAGIRAAREYPVAPAPGIIRILTFGDGLTHGSFVMNNRTWQEITGMLNHRFEVLNFGVDGYGPDQAFLRYRQEAGAWGHHVAILGITPANLDRLVSVFLPFCDNRTGMPLTKPRYTLDEGSMLTLMPNPFTSPSSYLNLLQNPRSEYVALGAHDYHYHRSFEEFHKPIGIWQLALTLPGRYLAPPIYRHGQLSTDSDVYHLTIRIMDEFQRLALKNQALPVVMFFPRKIDWDRARGDRPRIYQPLIDYCQDNHYRHIDLQHGFDLWEPVLESRRHFFPEMTENLNENIRRGEYVFYSMLANEFVAKYLLHYFNLNGLQDVAAITREVNTDIRYREEGIKRLSTLSQNRYAPGQIVEAEDAMVINLSAMTLQNYGYQPATIETDKNDFRIKWIVNGTILCEYDIAKAGRYRLRLHCRQGSSGGIITTRMGERKWRDWQIATDNQWQWVDAPFEWTLSPGPQPLMLSCRDAIGIDQIQLQLLP